MGAFKHYRFSPLNESNFKGKTSFTLTSIILLVKEKVQKKSLNEILFLMDILSKKSGYIVRNTWVIVILDVCGLEMRGAQ